MARGSLLYDVFVLNQAVGAMLVEGLAGTPLSPSEYAVYSFLFENPGCTPTEMARGLGMPMQTASDWLRNLRKRDHIRTERSAFDGRSYAITLTVQGRARQRETNKAFEKVNERFLRWLPAEEADFRTKFAILIEAATLVSQGADATSR